MNRETLQVTGKGKAKYEPSTGVIILNVYVQDKNSVDAQEGLKHKLVSIIDKVTSENNEFGIALKDVKTARQSLYPIYDYGKKNTRNLTAYKAHATITLTVHNISNLGKLMDMTVQNGAEIANVYFTESDTDKYKKEAMKKALKNAKETAELIASELNVTLDGIANVNTDLRYNGVSNTRGMFVEAQTMNLLANNSFASASTGTPIMPGEEEYDCTVNVVFYIKN